MDNARRDRYLTILELAPGASLAEVKTAYRELCLIWHPDKRPARVSARATQKLQALKDLTALNGPVILFVAAPALITALAARDEDMVEAAEVFEYPVKGW
jgi:hypothetical protein